MSSRVPETHRCTGMRMNGPEYDAVWVREHRLVRVGFPVTVLLGWEDRLRNMLLIDNVFDFEQNRTRDLDKLVFLSTDSNTRGFSDLLHLMNRKISISSFYNVQALNSIPCLISFNPVARQHFTEKMSELVYSIAKSGLGQSPFNSKILSFCHITSSFLHGIVSLCRRMSAW